MSGTVVQMVILVAMTHALRALGRIGGPRRCGLVLGLPSTTALMLFYSGHEHGVGEALAAAEASLLGVLAASVVPLAYARAVAAGAGPIGAPAWAVAVYVAVAALARALPDTGTLPRIGLALAGALAAGAWAGRGRIGGGESGPGSESRPGRESRLRGLGRGTAVPAALIVAVRLIRAVGGAGWSGLFTPFPAMSLAMLVATHLDDGPAASCRMARALPPGNLVLIAFLAAFRFVGPRAGLGWGAAVGYSAAIATLLALEGLVQSSPLAASRPGRPLDVPWNGPHRRRRGRRFAPRIETLPG